MPLLFVFFTSGGGVCGGICWRGLGRWRCSCWWWRWRLLLIVYYCVRNTTDLCVSVLCCFRGHSTHLQARSPIRVGGLPAVLFCVCVFFLYFCFEELTSPQQKIYVAPRHMYLVVFVILAGDRAPRRKHEPVARAVRPPRRGVRRFRVRGGGGGAVDRHALARAPRSVHGCRP